MRATVAAVALCLTACTGAPKAPASSATTTAGSIPAELLPPAVDGWREYALREGVVAIQPAKWRTDTVEIPVAAGADLEYKLTMKKGVSEFHGHTAQVDGVGDLMYYAKADGSPQNGSLTAPWDGIHGWYLKNTSPNDVVVRLELAGFYAIEAP